MTAEEIKILGEKIVSGNCSPEEKLTFLKELNGNMTDLFKELSDLKSKKELNSLRNE